MVVFSNGYIDTIQTWDPFQSVPASWDGDVPVVSGAGAIESWVYATPDDSVLKDYLSTASFPSQTLLDAMFTAPQDDPVQTGPLFDPLQFAVEAYDNLTTDTTDVMHVSISTPGPGSRSSNTGCQASYPSGS